MDRKCGIKFTCSRKWNATARKRKENEGRGAFASFSLFLVPSWNPTFPQPLINSQITLLICLFVAWNTFVGVSLYINYGFIIIIIIVGFIVGFIVGLRLIQVFICFYSFYWFYVFLVLLHVIILLVLLHVIFNSYMSLDCGETNEIKPKDPIKCQSCGHRIMYKKRSEQSKNFDWLSLFSVSFPLVVQYEARWSDSLFL